MTTYIFFLTYIPAFLWILVPLEPTLKTLFCPLMESIFIENKNRWGWRLEEMKRLSHIESIATGEQRIPHNKTALLLTTCNWSFMWNAPYLDLPEKLCIWNSGKKTFSCWSQEPKPAAAAVSVNPFTAPWQKQTEDYLQSQVILSSAAYLYYTKRGSAWYIVCGRKSWEGSGDSS